MKRLLFSIAIVFLTFPINTYEAFEVKSIQEMLQSDLFNNLNLQQQNLILGRIYNSSHPMSSMFSACLQRGDDFAELEAFYSKYSNLFPHSLSFPTQNSSEFGIENFEFNDNSRWSSTATNGGGLTQGDPTTLTWSFIPDGTSIYGYNGEPTSNSDLISMLDGQYPTVPAPPDLNDLTQRAWFVHFEDIFNRWSELTGNEYIYEPNDDGDPFTTIVFQGQTFASIALGSLGVRGDIRIGGHSIDGSAGSNTLAYNFFPNFGDMVIDTDNASFYGNTFSNSLGLRNTLSHEHGHGLGISHSCPIQQVKLMEPFISFNFDGPQFDDILAANRGYGDSLELNDNIASASDLGTIVDGIPFTQSDVSIDDNSDDDYYKFTVTSYANVSIVLTPLGSTYLSGPQNGNGSCSAGSNFNPQSQSDLSMELIATNGTTVIMTANSQPAGSVESITNQTLTDGAGTYYAKIEGSANAVQIYQLQISITNTTVLGCTNPSAHNYNPSANQDDGSCETCSDGVQNGDETNVDCGGVMCPTCITGCTDPLACDYNPSANVAGSCDYSCLGCTDPIANNYDNSATMDNGSCTYDCNTASVTVIDNSNVNTIIITSMDSLMTSGTLSLTADTVRYQAKQSITLNQNFTIDLGSLVSIEVDSCQ